MSLSEVCPPGYELSFQNVNKISITPSKIIMPEMYNDGVALPLVSKLYTFYCYPALSEVLQQQALDYWKATLKAGPVENKDDYETMIAMVVEDQVPECISLNLSSKNRKSKCNTYMLLNFALSYTELQSQVSNSVTVEHYIKLDEHNKFESLLLTTKEKSAASKEINKSFHTKPVLENLLQNVTLDKNYTYTGIQDVSEKGIVLTHMLEPRAPYNAFKVATYNNNRERVEHTHLAVPKIRVHNDTTIQIGLHAFVAVSRRNYSVDAVDSEIVLQGIKFAKGQWKSTGSKQCVMSYPKNEAVADVIDFIEGGNKNPLIGKFYEVAHRRDDLVILSGSEDNKTHLVFLQLVNDGIDFLYSGSTLPSTNNVNNDVLAWGRFSDKAKKMLDEFALVNSLMH